MKRKGGRTRTAPAPRRLVPVACSVLGYPALAGVVLGAACASEHDAAPPPAPHVVAPTPVAATPPAAPSLPTPPVALAPPPPGLVPPPPGETALPHEGDPCPAHGDGTVLTEAAAARLPRERRNRLHPIGGIGVAGRPHMFGGASVSVQPGGLDDLLAGPIGRVVVLPPQVRGSIPVDMIRARTLQHGGELRHCYTIALQADPTLHGHIELEYVVDATGTIQSAHVTQVSSQALDPVAACIVARVSHWPMPASGGGIAVVDQPLDLDPDR